MTMLLLPQNHDADTLPAGWRPSTACWTRKAIQIVDPERYLFAERGTGEVVDFDRGIGQRGHDIEALVLGRVFGLSAHGMARVLKGEHLRRGELECGGRVATQAKLPLPYGGVSHIDWIITGSPRQGFNGTWEHKSSTRDTIPTSDHYEVVQLRMVLAEMAGIELPSPWRLLLTDPASYRVHGPFTVSLTDHRRKELRAKLVRLGWVLDRLDVIDTRDPDAFGGLVCTCGQCFAPKPAERAQDLDALLSLYAQAQHAIETGDDPVFAMQEQEQIREQIRTIIDPGTRHEAPCGWIARTTNPRPKTITQWDKADQAGLIADAVGGEAYAALMDALRLEGYSRVKTAKPSLTIERKRVKA